jgi:hypothetical protein
MPRIVELEGEAIGELSTLIASAFDRQELKFLLKVKLDFDLERELGTATGDDQLVFELILALERRGAVVDFLRRVIEARPKRDDLRAAVGRNCPEALQPAPDVKVTANAVAASIDAVKAKLDDPEVRNLVAPHRDELVQLMDGIEVLANYKRLHDYLQTIQLTHQLQMVSDIQRLRSDEIAGTTLDAHLFDLNDICGKALAAAKALPDTAAVRAAELRWIDKLKLVIDQIQRAVDGLDDREGARALRALRLLIRPESYRINGLLSAAADRLPLERLTSTVADVARATTVGGAATTELRDGLQSLQNMLPQLKGRVAEHNQWQDIEREFILTDEFTDQGTPDSIQDFQDGWPAMRQSVAALAQTEPAAPWALKAQTLATTIDANLSGNIDKARTGFTVFRRTVQFHFFEVDRALRSQCEAVLAIRVPLKSLLSEV